jgi:hypothetical protein
VPELPRKGRSAIHRVAVYSYNEATSGASSHSLVATRTMSHV